MNAKSKNTPHSWVDPDDAPELTDEFFENAVWRIGERDVPVEEGKAAMKAAIRLGRPKVESPKQAVTIRYDADIIEAFRATGTGWQTRINAALRQYISEHPLK